MAKHKKRIVAENKEENFEKTTEKSKKELTYGQKIIYILSAVVAVLCALCIGLSVFFVVSGKEGTQIKQNEENTDKPILNGFVDYQFSANKMPKGLYADFVFSENGKEYPVEVYLFREYAPNTVNNFIYYAKRGFYNDKVFGKVNLEYDKSGIPNSGKIICGGFVRGENNELEGVLPDGEPKQIKGEFLENGYDKNRLSNTAGVLGLMHGKSNDDGMTDFYILPYDDLHLNGKFAGFGKITTLDGLETIRILARKAFEENKTVFIKSVAIRNKD